MRKSVTQHVFLVGLHRPAAVAILLAAFLFLLLSGISGRASAQQQGILIAGASPTQPYALLRGCNQVVSDAPNGAKLAGMVTLVSPGDSVSSIWRFNNATQTFQVGYFADASAPTDFTVMGKAASGRSTETYFVCVLKAAVIVGG